MLAKQPYVAPEAEIILLQTERTILVGSVNSIGIGPNILFDPEESFDTFFII